MTTTHILANANGTRYEVEMTFQSKVTTSYNMAIDGQTESFQMETPIWNLLAVPAGDPVAQIVREARTGLLPQCTPDNPCDTHRRQQEREARSVVRQVYGSHVL